MSKVNKLTKKSIHDFGEQWSHFTKNDNYYGSAEIFLDICGPEFDEEKIHDAFIVDVGAGTGRLVGPLLSCGAKSILAIEPSAAFKVLLENTSQYGESVRALQIPGDQLPSGLQADLIVSIGVLHHIPDPKPVMNAIYNSLKKGGTILIWLYGSEGNWPYLIFVRPLRFITVKLPHSWLLKISKCLEPLLHFYAKLCKYVNLPLNTYMQNHIAKLDKEARVITIYDQLNPAYSKYYSRNEAIELMRMANFKDIVCKHRHGYSWTLYGTKD